MIIGTKRYTDILSEIPVSINSNYGDAFQPTQWDDTINKLQKLSESSHKGPVMIGSKYIISDLQLQELKNINPDVWIFISITGIENSCRFSFSEYCDYYKRACKILKNVVCVIRPIIPLRNDKHSILLPIIEMTAQGRKMLTYGGFKDPKADGSPQYRNEDLFSWIENECRKRSICCTEKTVCLVNEINHTNCFHHCKTMPINLDIISDFGYNYEFDGEKIIVSGWNGISKVTSGDISFIKMLCKSSLVVPKHLYKSLVLSIKLGDTPLVCTSSWFNWATQKHCVVKCDYCFAGENVDTRIDLDYYGCNPIDLLSVLQS